MNPYGVHNSLGELIGHLLMWFLKVPYFTASDFEAKVNYPYLRHH